MNNMLQWYDCSLYVLYVSFVRSFIRFIKSLQHEWMFLQRSYKIYTVTLHIKRIWSRNFRNKSRIVWSSYNWTRRSNIEDPSKTAGTLLNSSRLCTEILTNSITYGQHFNIRDHIKNILKQPTSKIRVTKDNFVKTESRRLVIIF